MTGEVPRCIIVLPGFRNVTNVSALNWAIIAMFNETMLIFKLVQGLDCHQAIASRILHYQSLNRYPIHWGMSTWPTGVPHGDPSMLCIHSSSHLYVPLPRNITIPTAITLSTYISCNEPSKSLDALCAFYFTIYPHKIWSGRTNSNCEWHIKFECVHRMLALWNKCPHTLQLLARNYRMLAIFDIITVRSSLMVVRCTEFLLVSFRFKHESMWCFQIQVMMFI